MAVELWKDSHFSSSAKAAQNRRSKHTIQELKKEGRDFFWREMEEEGVGLYSIHIGIYALFVCQLINQIIMLLSTYYVF